MVLEHGSPLGLDGRNVFVIHTCWLHMCSLCFWFMCFLCMYGGGHCCRCDFMQNLMVLISECVHHECITVVYVFVMHVSVYILLCMHCHGYGYECMVGKICIVSSMYVIRSS